VPLPFFADAVAPCIATAQAIGRLGNWFNQELYGGPTTLPWGLENNRRVDPATGLTDPLAGVATDSTPIAIVQPTFLYELLWNLGVAGVVVLADRRFRLGHGRAFAVYVAGYTLGRFFIELIRTDPATRVFGDIRINVVVAAVVFLGAVAYLVVVRKPREEPPFAREGRDADPTVGPAGDTADLPGPADPDHADPDHADPDHADPDHADPDHADPDHADADHADAGYADAGYADPDHADADHADDPRPAGAVHDPGQVNPVHANPDHVDRDHAGVVHADPADDAAAAPRYADHRPAAARPARDGPADDTRQRVPADAPSGAGPEPAPDRTP
jgi:hypothetical protein